MRYFRIFNFTLFSLIALVNSQSCPTNLDQSVCDSTSDCTWADITGEEVFGCVSKNCKSIDLRFDLPSPYGCPPELCTLDGFNCVNRDIVDILVDGVFQAEAKGQFSIRYLFWFLLLSFTILLILFKMPRILAYITTRLVWFMFIRRSDSNDQPSALSIGSLSIALLGGKLKLNDIEYVSIDHRVVVSEVVIKFRWWLGLNQVRRPKKHKETGEDSSSNDKKPCRLSFYIKGLEVFVFNNSKRFDDLQDLLAGKKDKPEDPDLEEKALKFLEESQINQVPWVYNWFPATDFKFSSISLQVGESRLPTTLLLHLKGGEASHFASKIPSTCPNQAADLYRTVNKFRFKSVLVTHRVNLQFKGVSFMQASISEVLLGKTTKGTNGEGSNLLGVMKDFVSYVKDIFDEEVMFTPPDLSVGLTGGDYQDTDTLNIENSGDESDSDEESLSNLSRNSSFRSMWKTSGSTRLHSGTSRRVKASDERSGNRDTVKSSWLSNFTSKFKKKKPVKKPLRQPIKEKHSTAIPEPPILSAENIFVAVIIDVPGKKIIDRVECFTGTPAFVVNIEMGSKDSKNKLCFGPWHNSIRVLFQDRFLTDTFQTSVYSFLTGGNREAPECEINIKTVGETSFRVPFRGRDPETLISESLESYRSRSTYENARLFESLVTPLETLRHGKKKTTKEAEVNTKVSESSSFLNAIIEVAPAVDLTSAAANNIEWLVSSEEIKNVENWPVRLSNVLIEGWLVDIILNDLLVLRELYLTKKNLSKFNVKGEKEKVIAVRFYQASLINVAQSLIKSHTKKELAEKFMLLDEDLVFDGSESFAKLIWKKYICQECLFVKELHFFRKYIDKSIYKTFMLSYKNLPLSFLFEERISGSKTLRKLNNVKAGDELNFMKKSFVRAKRSKKFSADVQLLERSIPLMSKETARLPRWLNIFDTKFDIRKDSLREQLSQTQFASNNLGAEAYSNFVGPISYARSTNFVCKWFEISTKAESSFNFIIPFSSVNGVNCNIATFVELTQCSIKCSQTDSKIVDSKDVTIRMSQTTPLSRTKAMKQVVDIQMNSSNLFIIREVDSCFNELVADWSDNSSLAVLRNYESPELFFPSQYKIFIQGYDSKLYFCTNKDNVIDEPDNLENNHFVEACIPEFKVELGIGQNSFEDTDGLVTWRVSLFGDKDWKTNCVLSLLYPRSHSRNELTAPCYKQKSDKQKIKKVQKCLEFKSLVITGENKLCQVKGQPYNKRTINLDLVSNGVTVLLLPEVISSFLCLQDNYFGQNTWSISSSDYAVCNGKNLRTMLADLLAKEEYTPTNPGGDMVLNFENKNCEIILPTSCFVELEKHASLRSLSLRSLRLRTKILSFSLVSRARTSFNLSLNIPVVHLEIPDASILGTRKTPGKSSAHGMTTQVVIPAKFGEYHGDVEKLPEATNSIQYQNYTKVSGDGSQGGLISIRNIRFGVAIKYKRASVPKEHTIYLQAEKKYSFVMGRVRGEIELAQIQGILRALQAYKNGMYRINSSSANKGGYNVKKTAINLRETVPRSLILFNASKEATSFIVKGFVGSFVLPRHNHNSAQDSQKFYFEAAYGSQLFKSKRVFLSANSTLHWNETFTFMTTERLPLKVTVFVVEKMHSEQLGYADFSVESLNSCSSRNTATLGTLLDSRGINNGQLKNAIKWCSLAPAANFSSLLCEKAAFSDLIQAKLNKVNTLHGGADIPLHTIAIEKLKTVLIACSFQRKYPLRISVAVAACEVFSLDDSKSNVMDKDMYTTRCFRFATNMCTPKIDSKNHSRNASRNKGLEPADHLAHIAEGTRILRRISQYERLPNASQTIALALFAEEAFLEANNKYSPIALDLKFGGLNICLLGTKLSTATVINVCNFTVKGRTIISNKYDWNLSSTPVNLDIQLLQALSENSKVIKSDVKKYSSHGSEWLVLSQVCFSYLFLYRHADKGMLYQRFLTFKEKLISSSNCTLKVKLMKEFLPNTSRKSSKIKRLTRKKKKKNFEVPIAIPERDAESDTESFVSAIESKEEETKIAFEEMFLRDKREELDIEKLFVSVNDPLPLSPGMSSAETIFLAKYLPTRILKYKKLTLLETGKDAEVDVMDKYGWNSRNREFLPGMSSVQLSEFEPISAKIEQLIAVKDDFLKVDDQVGKKLVIRAAVSGYITSAVASTLDDFILVSKPITPSLDQMFDVFYLTSSSPVSSNNLDDINLDLEVDKCVLDLIQVAPQKNDIVNDGCMLRTRFGIEKFSMQHTSSITENQETKLSFSTDKAKVEFFAFGTTGSKHSFKWCKVGRLALTSLHSLLVKKSDSAITLSKVLIKLVDIKLTSDAVCAFHSVAGRWTEEILGCYESYMAVKFRFEQQWALLAGQVVRLIYSVNQTLPGSSSHFKKVKEAVASNEWNDYYMRKKVTLDSWSTMVRLRSLLKHIPDKIQAEKVLANVPFDRYGNVNPLPPEYLADVVFLKKYFSKQTWSDSGMLKPESVFVNEILNSSLANQSHSDYQKLISDFSVNVNVAAFRIEITGGNRMSNNSTDIKDLLLKPSNNISMKFLVSNLSQTIGLQTVKEVVRMEADLQIKNINLVANPLLLHFILTSLQVSQSIEGFVVSYKRLLSVHAKYHDSLIANWQNDIQPFSFVRQGTDVQDLDSSTVHEMESIFDPDENVDEIQEISLEHGWSDIKQNRVATQQKLWLESLPENTRQRVVSTSSGQDTINELPVLDFSRLQTVNRKHRSETLSLRNKRPRLSYDEASLHDLFLSEREDIQHKNSYTDISKLAAQKAPTTKFHILSKLQLKKVSIILSTSIPASYLLSCTENKRKTTQFRPLLHVTCTSVCLSSSNLPATNESKIFKKPVGDFTLSAVHSLSSQTVRVTFGETKSLESTKKIVSDISWEAYGVESYINEGYESISRANVSSALPFKQNNDFKEARFFIKVEQSLLDLSNWKISLNQLNSFIHQWQGIYKDFGSHSDGNKKFIERQNIFYQAVTAEESKLLSKKESQKKPTQTWREMRHNVYKAAKNTTSSVERYVIEGLKNKSSRKLTIHACVTDGTLRLSPTKKVIVEYNLSKVILNVVKEQQESIKCLFWVGRSNFSLSKKVGGNMYVKVINQPMPSFWLQFNFSIAEYMKTSTGRKVHDFDIRIIIQKITSDIAPSIVEDVVSLQGDLAQEILLALNSLAKIANQWKDQNITEAGNLATGQQSESIDIEGMKKYRVLVFMEGINVKANNIVGNTESSWVDADSGGVQLTLEWTPVLLHDSSYIIRLTKCSLLLEGMNFKAYNPALGSEPIFLANTTMSVEQLESTVKDPISPVPGLAAFISDLTIETQPETIGVLENIISSYVYAVKNYKQLLEEKMTVIQTEHKVVSPKEAAESMSERIVLTVTSIWNNLRDPLGKEINNAANQLEVIAFAMKIEKTKLSIVFGSPNEESRVSSFLVFADTLTVEGTVKLTGFGVVKQEWKKATMLTEFKLYKLEIMPLMTTTFPVFTNLQVKKNSNVALTFPTVRMMFHLQNSHTRTWVLLGAPKLQLDQLLLEVTNNAFKAEEWACGTEEIVQPLESTGDNTILKIFQLFSSAHLKLERGSCEILSSNQESRNVTVVASLPLPEFVIFLSTNSRESLVFSLKIRADPLKFNFALFSYMTELAQVFAALNSRKVMKTKPKPFTSAISLEVSTNALQLSYSPGQESTSVIILSLKFGVSLTFLFDKERSMSQLCLSIPMAKVSLGQYDSAGVNAKLEGMYMLQTYTYVDNKTMCMNSIEEIDFGCDFWKVDSLSLFCDEQLKCQAETRKMLNQRPTDRKDIFSPSDILIWDPFEDSQLWESRIIRCWSLKKGVGKFCLGDVDSSIEAIVRDGLSRFDHSSDKPGSLIVSVSLIEGNFEGNLLGNLVLENGLSFGVSLEPFSNSVVKSYEVDSFVSAESLTEQLDEFPTAPLTFQSFLYKRKGLVQIELEIPVASFEISVFNSFSRKQLPLLFFEKKETKLFLKEEVNTTTTQCLTESSVSVKSLEVSFTIDAIKDCRDIIDKSILVLKENLLDKLPQAAVEKKKKMYPDVFRKIGKLNVDTKSAKLSLINGVQANALSAAATSINIVDLKWFCMTQLRNSYLETESKLDIKTATVSRFQQLLPNSGSGNNVRSLDIADLKASIFSRRKRREKIIFQFPQTSVLLRTETEYEWKQTLLETIDRRRWKAILGNVIKFSFQSKFSRVINVSTDLRDYTYLKEMVVLFLEKIKFTHPETVETCERDFLRKGGSTDFEFNPKLNVIGDATSLALNLVLSKLDVKRSAIPEKYYDSIVGPSQDIVGIFNSFLLFAFERMADSQ